MRVTLVVVFAMAVAASGAPHYHQSHLEPIKISYSKQFHGQDGLGNYKYGYADDLSTKKETKGEDGVTRGEYSYVDANGVVQTVTYTSDKKNGFQAVASNLPMAPAAVDETPEVKAAKAQHLAAVEEAKVQAALHPEQPETEAPAYLHQPWVVPEPFGYGTHSVHYELPKKQPQEEKHVGDGVQHGHWAW